jgi:copper chaperone CopZ
VTEATERTYAVKGMARDDCQASVTDEVERVPGVAGVEEVDRQAGGWP